MTILYFLGAADSHRLSRDYDKRVIVFQRADDEPHPYAHVDQEEAEAIAADAPDLFAIKGALPGNVEPSDPPHPGAAGPVISTTPVRRTRKAK